MITNFQEIHIALVSVLMNQNRQPETIRRYTEVLNAIIRFHKKQGLNEANVEQIVEFQKIKNNYSVAIGASLESVRRWERAILVILKVIHNDKIEIEKAINSFEKVDALGNKIFVSITNQDIWPDTFKKIFIKFKNYSLQKLAIDTCNKYLYIVKRFFQNLINVGIDDLNNINEDKFLNAITEITSRSQYGTKQIIGIKSFFAWAYRNNEITKDYSEYLNFQSAKYIPNVLFFSEEQINKLLSNIDLTTYDGKMFHAIITVAKTTGLRKTDICMLKIKDFDWNNKIINVKQSKTGKYITVQRDFWDLFEFNRRM